MSTKPIVEITEMLRRANEVVPPGSLWQHLSTGGMYRVSGIGIIEADVTLAVAYRRADESNDIVWIRPYAGFCIRFKQAGDKVVFKDAGAAEFDIRCKACGATGCEIQDDRAMGSSQTGPYGSVDITCPKCGAYKTIRDA